jgi:hypothetical protein
MKKLFLLWLFLAFSANLQAHETKAQKVKQDVKETANKVADKTEEATVKT